MTSKTQPPESILIVGTGVFGLSTLSALLARPQYASTTFIVLAPASQHTHTASVDSTRIVRSDYTDAAYYALAAEAQQHWRQAPWNEHYREPGLLLSYSQDSSEQAGKSGEDYVRGTLRTVSASVAANIEVFSSQFALMRAMAVPSPALAAAHGSSAGAPVRGSGVGGYINRRSGWADAGGALNALRRRLEREGGRRVKWIDGEATRLLTNSAGATDGTSKQRVLGVETAAGERVLASLTILATGAWTPTLLDLRGVASCTAQCMAYVSLSDAEAAKLARIPVCFNLSKGIFFFPPTKRAAATTRTTGKQHRWDMKVARHAYGYSNPQPTPFGVQSLPSAFGTPIPDKDRTELLSFLSETLPFLGIVSSVARGKREVTTRLCHYLDTEDGDWLVTHHPQFENDSLFIATGGSGHGYKFLPVLGERIVDVLEQRDTDETRVWTGRWAWRERQPGEQHDTVWCEDGSRAGVKGLTLQTAGSPKARI